MVLTAPPASFPTSAGARSDPPAHAPADMLVPARWLPLIRVLWLVLMLLGAALIIAGLPGHLVALHTACTDPICINVGWYLSPAGMRQAQDLGLSLDLFAAFVVAMQLLSSIVFVGGSALIVWRRANEWMGLVTAFFLLSFGLASPGGIAERMAAAHRGWGTAIAALVVCGDIGLSVFLYFFPDGQFRPRWLWWAILAWCLAWLPGDLSPTSTVGSRHWPPFLEPVLLVFFFTLAAGVQIWRYRHVSNTLQRRQTKWVVYGMLVVLLGHITLYPIARITFGRQFGSPVQVAVKGAFYLLLTLIPVSLTIAILRHRLWDIDVVINRTLVYGTLTAAIVGLYTVVVGGVGTLLRGAGAPLLPFFATAVIATLFQPLRAWLQRRVNRLLYGERDEPYAALARLGQRLESTLTPDDALRTIVQTVRDALRLPYAVITVTGVPDALIAVESGTPASTRLHLPLVYGQEPIGELHLAPRAPGEEFSAADRYLLNDLAHQAGIAVQSVRLSAEAFQLSRALQQSRARLVTAREEERRRLRRDLHDGLGPQLAGFTLRLDVAKNLLRRDPTAAEEILSDLSTRSQALMADIRQLVYALRPPALDELGLIGALRQHAAGYDATGLTVVVIAPATLPSLPAAVEVAAYRIVQEALTNVVRHARACICTVTLTLDRGAADTGMTTVVNALRLVIHDDGQGFSSQHQVGVGRQSMRERAAELGGHCTIESTTHGTTVHACLPLVDSTTQGADAAHPTQPGPLLAARDRIV